MSPPSPSGSCTIVENSLPGTIFTTEPALTAKPVCALVIHDTATRPGPGDDRGSLRGWLGVGAPGVGGGAGGRQARHARLGGVRRAGVRGQPGRLRRPVVVGVADGAPALGAVPVEAAVASRRGRAMPGPVLP